MGVKLGHRHAAANPGLDATAARVIEVVDV
jgi:hypothetical protein